jgi:PhoH-like ATPase
VIIIDEAQNIGHATMQKLISRIGKNCKVIVIGSNRQIDSKYLTKWNNGMSILLGYCKKPGFSTDVGIFAINLEKTVRSKIAKFAEELFSGQS